jgi:hypothetical protein
MKKSFYFSIFIATLTSCSTDNDSVGMEDSANLSIFNTAESLKTTDVQTTTEITIDGINFLSNSPSIVEVYSQEQTLELIYEFENSEAYSILTVDENDEKIYIQFTDNDEIYTLSDFVLTEDSFVIEGQVISSSGDIFQFTLPTEGLVTQSWCATCAFEAMKKVIDKAGDTFREILGAAREHRRLTSCDSAVNQCYDAGKCPTMSVTEGGGCAVECKAC